MKNLKLFFILLFLVLLNNCTGLDQAMGGKNRKNSEIDNLIHIENIPVLKNDTNNVISFNSGYEETGKNTFKRNFWELFK